MTAPGRNTYAIWVISSSKPRCRWSISSRPIADSALIVTATATSMGRRDTAASLRSSRTDAATGEDAPIRAPPSQRPDSRFHEARTQHAATPANTHWYPTTGTRTTAGTRTIQPPASSAAINSANAPESTRSRSPTMARMPIHTNAPAAPVTSAAHAASSRLVDRA